jgi:hypothetical protein
VDQHDGASRREIVEVAGTDAVDQELVAVPSRIVPHDDVTPVGHAASVASRRSPAGSVELGSD